MNTPLRYETNAGRGQAAAVYDEGLRQHMLRVYNYMGLGLVVTGVVAFVVGVDAGTLRADLLHPAQMGGDARAARLRALLLVPHPVDVGSRRTRRCSGPSAR